MMVFFFQRGQTLLLSVDFLPLWQRNWLKQFERCSQSKKQDRKVTRHILPLFWWFFSCPSYIHWPWLQGLHWIQRSPWWWSTSENSILGTWLVGVGIYIYIYGRWLQIISLNILILPQFRILNLKHAKKRDNSQYATRFTRKCTCVLVTCCSLICFFVVQFVTSPLDGLPPESSCLLQQRPQNE